MERTFSLILISAILLFASCSAPVANTITSANAKESQKTANTKNIETYGCREGRTILNHEPPIGMGRGSAYLDIEGGAIVDLGTPTGPVSGGPENGMYRYEIVSAMETYTHIDCISILTEDAEPDFKVVKFEDNSASLNLWLGAVPGTPTGQKDFTFKCNSNGNGPCWLFARKKFKDKSSNEKKVRKKRYWDKGKKDFVIQWEIEGSLNARDSDDDMYYIHVWFGHPNRENLEQGNTNTGSK